MWPSVLKGINLTNTDNSLTVNMPVPPEITPLPFRVRFKIFEIWSDGSSMELFPSQILHMIQIFRLNLKFESYWFVKVGNKGRITLQGGFQNVLEKMSRISLALCPNNSRWFQGLLNILTTILKSLKKVDISVRGGWPINKNCRLNASHMNVFKVVLGTTQYKNRFSHLYLFVIYVLL